MGEFRDSIDLDPDTNQVIKYGYRTNSSAFILTLDLNGSYSSGRTIGIPSVIAFHRITPHKLFITQRKEILVGGVFYGIVDFDPHPTNSVIRNSGQTANLFILKLNANGNFNFVKNWEYHGSSSINNIDDLKVAQNGDIYCSGIVGGASDFDPGPGASIIGKGGAFSLIQNAFLTKLDSLGNFQWAKSFNHQSNIGESQGNGIALAANGMVYLTGAFRDSVDFDPDSNTVDIRVAHPFSLYMAQFTPTGTLNWVKEVECTDAVLVFDVETDQHSNLYVSGLFGDSIDFDSDTAVVVHRMAPAGTASAFLLKTDENFAHRWNTYFTASPVATIYDMELGPSADSIYMVGRFSDTIDFNPPFKTDILYSATQSNYVLKLNQGVLTSLEESTFTSEKNDFSVYPNPTSGAITLLNKGTQPISILLVRNTIGQVIAEVKTPNKRSTFNIDGAKGLYFIEIYTLDGKRSTLKVVKE